MSRFKSILFSLHACLNSGRYQNLLLGSKMYQPSFYRMFEALYTAARHVATLSSASSAIRTDALYTHPQTIFSRSLARNLKMSLAPTAQTRRMLVRLRTSDSASDSDYEDWETPLYSVVSCASRLCRASLRAHQRLFIGSLDSSRKHWVIYQIVHFSSASHSSYQTHKSAASTTCDKLQCFLSPRVMSTNLLSHRTSRTLWRVGFRHYRRCHAKPFHYGSCQVPGHTSCKRPLSPFFVCVVLPGMSLKQHLVPCCSFPHKLRHSDILLAGQSSPRKHKT